MGIGAAAEPVVSDALPPWLLGDSGRVLAHLIERAGGALIKLDAGRCLTLSPKAARLLGWPETGATLPLVALAAQVPIEDWGNFTAHLQRCLVEGIDAHIPIRLLRVNGSLLTATCHAIRIQTDPACEVLILLTDAARETLPEQQNPAVARELNRDATHFWLAVEATRDAVWEWDRNSGEAYVSPRLAELLGMPVQALNPPQVRVREQMHPYDRARVHSVLRDQLCGGQPLKFEFRLRTGTGGYRWFQCDGKVERDATGHIQYIAGSLSDIHEQKETQRRLERSRQRAEDLTHRLQELSARLVQTQEEERRAIARELHDDVGQLLTAAVLNLEFWRNQPLPAVEQDEIIASIKTALARVRDLSLNLRPPLLDENGLEAALRWFLDRQAAVGRISTHLTVAPMKKRLPAAVEITVFRIVQEATTNALRHARANNVWVGVTREQDTLTVIVSDDGIGFTVEESLARASGGASLGLLGMGERARLLGGSCEILSTPGVGSRIQAQLPVGGWKQMNRER